MPDIKPPARKSATLTYEPTTPEALATGRDKSAIHADAAWLSMPQIETQIGLNRTRIYKWIREGLFPHPIKLGKTARWPRAEIEQWLENIAATRSLKDGGVK